MVPVWVVPSPDIPVVTYMDLLDCNNTLLLGSDTGLLAQTCCIPKQISCHFFPEIVWTLVTREVIYLLDMMQ